MISVDLWPKQHPAALGYNQFILRNRAGGIVGVANPSLGIWLASIDPNLQIINATTLPGQDFGYRRLRSGATEDLVASGGHFRVSVAFDVAPSLFRCASGKVWDDTFCVVTGSGFLLDLSEYELVPTPDAWLHLDTAR